MAIPFTQYVLPHGRKRAESIERPPEIETLAHKFINGGGWYECEVLTTGHVSFTACLNTDEDGPQDIEIVISKNGPEVLDAVDKLVRASVKHVSA